MPNGHIAVPPEIASQIPPGERSLLCWPGAFLRKKVDGARQGGVDSSPLTLLKTLFMNS